LPVFLCFFLPRKEKRVNNRLEEDENNGVGVRKIQKTNGDKEWVVFKENSNLIHILFLA